VAYNLPWDWDEVSSSSIQKPPPSSNNNPLLQHDSNYIIIKKWVTEDFQEELFAHSRRIREDKVIRSSTSINRHVASPRSSKKQTKFDFRRRNSPPIGDIRITTENSRRRRPQRAEQHYDAENESQGEELEDQLSAVEQYQDARVGRSTTAVLPGDNNSRKSRSNSSHESVTGSKTGGGNNMSLMMDGIKLGFNEEAVHGKMINIRSDDNGDIRLRLGGNANRKPKARRS
jgi:hypothetical protein